MVPRRGRKQGCYGRAGAYHKPPEGAGRSQKHPRVSADFPRGVFPSKRSDGIRRFLRAGKDS